MEQQKNNKLKQFFKKNWKYIVILIAVLFFVIISKPYKEKKDQISTSSPIPASSKTAEFKGIKPGESDIEKVNSILGLPIKSESLKNQETFFYETSNQYINHEVSMKNNSVGIIREKIIFGNETNADTIREQYGIAPFVLYEQAPSSVFDLYVYPKNGIAFIGHVDGTLLEIWYFEQTNINDFISNWGQGYSENEYKGQVQY